MKKRYENLKNYIGVIKTRSAWKRAVKTYALELLEELEESSPDTVANYNEGTPIKSKDLLNGADNWLHYSEGGCSLIYNGDIAERICTASELKKTKGGDRNPNGRETWLDCQARALSQACSMIIRNESRIATA